MLQVTIGQTEFAVDCTHGSGSYSKGKFEPKFTRFYFFTPPEKLILTHWVEDEQYRLLENKVNKEDLEKLVVLKEVNFCDGIMPETLSQSITIPSTSSTVQIEINTSTDVTLTASLQKIDENGKLCSDFEHDNNNSLTFIQWKERKAIVHAIVPKKGKYLLKVYKAVLDTDVSTRYTRYSGCLSYFLTADHELQDSEYIGYPDVQEMSCANAGFSLQTQEESSCVAHKCIVMDKLEMMLRSKHPLALNHYICEGKITNSNGVSRYFSYSQLSIDENDPERCSLNVVFPKQGWWTVFIINSADRYRLVQYQVFTKRLCDREFYPSIKEPAKTLGIALVNNHDFVCYAKAPFVAINFTALPGLDYLVEFKKVKDDSKAKHSHYTHVTPPSKQTCAGCVYAIVPPGEWCLDLYVKETQYKSFKQIISAELLYGTEQMKAKVFPKITSAFSRMELLSPTNLEEWILPETVSAAEYPKTISIPFIQALSNRRIQLSCSVKLESDEESDTVCSIEMDSAVKLKIQEQNEHSIYRVLEIVVSKKGTWKLILQGRYLDSDEGTYLHLMEYVTVGL